MHRRVVFHQSVPREAYYYTLAEVRIALTTKAQAWIHGVLEQEASRKETSCKFILSIQSINQSSPQELQVSEPFPET